MNEIYTQCIKKKLLKPDAGSGLSKQQLPPLKTSKLCTNQSATHVRDIHPQDPQGTLVVGHTCNHFVGVQS